MVYNIKLEPDYCCGGGHCGPMPGYYYFCPGCKIDSSAPIGYPIQVGQFLTCRNCKTKIEAKERYNEYLFDFVMVDNNKL